MLNMILIFPCVSAEERAFVTLETCRQLTNYIPADDVAYKAGVDVRGKAVKPADVESNSTYSDLIELNKEISFRLILDVATFAKSRGNTTIPLDAQKGIRGEIPLGLVTIKEGIVTLDGKPLSADQQKQVYLLCEESKKKQGKIKK